MQTDNIALYKQKFSDVSSPSVLLSPAGNNSVISGKNVDFADNEEKIDSNDLYLLLLVCVHCFCVPVFSLTVKYLGGYIKKSNSNLCDNNTRICIEQNISFMENKDYLPLLFLLIKEQIEFNLLYRNQLSETVCL